jgi:hypothetical protein
MTVLRRVDHVGTAMATRRSSSRPAGSASRISNKNHSFLIFVDAPDPGPIPLPPIASSPRREGAFGRSSGLAFMGFYGMISDR